MHAEMTVGLDLTSLENLKIFNGYEKVKKENKNSPDPNVSSQEDDSDYGPGQLTDKKSKCGRPANPLPRHKRDAHIRAEYKRRDKIQQGFDNLIKLVPDLRESSSTRESKSVMLFKTAEYCRRLKAENGDIQNEMWALREELEALGTDIHKLQEQLPQHGVEGVDKEKKMQMDDFYDDFVQQRIKSNWRFWLFGFFMRPLYQSYRVATSRPQSISEFTTTVNTWIQETLSLTSLRRSFLEGLRKISTRTKIMTAPEKLEEEAIGNIGAHCIIPKLEAMAAVSPNPRPSTPKHASTSTPIFTPLSSPAHTPPRTPTSSRRSNRRESSRKTHQSRSRSSSPQNPESKPKRRPSYRSEKTSQLSLSVSEASDQKASSFSSASSPSMDNSPSPYSHTSKTPSPDPKLVIMSPPSETPIQTSSAKLIQLLTTIASGTSQSTMATSSQTIPSIQPQTVSAPFIFLPFNLTNIPAVITNPCPTQQLPHQTNFSNLPVTVSSMEPNFLSGASPQSHFSTQSPGLFSTATLQTSVEMKAENHEQMKPSTVASQPLMEVDTVMSSVPSFVPILQSGTISNGTLDLQGQTPQLIDGEHETTLCHDSISDFSSMDILPDSNDTMFGAMPMFSSPMATQSYSTKSDFPSATSSDTQLHSVMSETDDDSLMKMLTLDVMDVGSVMNFLNDHKDIRTNTPQKDDL